MAKEKNEEQEFLRELDRILAGEEVTPGRDAGEDYRATIEFARKLGELRKDPAPEFQERLKLRLLLKLTEQEVAARERVPARRLRDFLGRLVPQSPVMRTAVVSVAIVLAAAGVMWRTGLFTPVVTPEGEGVITEQNDRGIQEMMATGEDTAPKAWDDREEEEAPLVLTLPESGDYVSAAGEELQIEVEISPSGATASLIGTRLTAAYGIEVTLVIAFRNTSPETVIISPVPPQIDIMGGPEIGLVYTLSANDSPVELLPSEPFRVLFAWEQQDDGGNQVDPGAYTFYTSPIVITRGTSVFEIPLPPAELVIEEP